MIKKKPLISVITCAHNEEKYVGKCLASIRKAFKNFEGEIVFVADRCSDGTVQIAKHYNVEKLVIKSWKKWKNSYAESLQAGFLNSAGQYVCIVDADIVLPEVFFEKLLPLVKCKIASTSTKVETYPSSLLNNVCHAWEKTHEITPFVREPRGAARIIQRDVLHKIGGFRDVLAPDTDLDIRIKKEGYKSIYVKEIKVWHIRRINLRKIINSQVSSGIARVQLQVGFARTLAHSIFRLRLFVTYGWLLAQLKRENLAE
ncbi:MAG: glycosyltransferase [Candidatus Bathyarchaeia archaeon]